MKRLVIIPAIIAILGVFFPFFSILAQPIHVPHENPTLATDSLDKVALLLSYSQIFNLATSRQYSDARDLLNELRHADIPDELRYLIDRYSHLCQQLFTTLDNLESLLDEASTLISRHEIYEAKQRLDNAAAAIHDAQLMLAEIEGATDTLSNQLGVFAAPATSMIRQAHTRLENSLERLRQLIDELNKLYESLAEKQKIQAMKLVPTELSLSITPASVFIGDTITASGRLSSSGKPLGNRRLTLTLDNNPIAATTANDGSYFTSITIPYKYVTTMTLKTQYEPSLDDTGIYLASHSQPAIINTMFYPALLEVSAPETAHPGLPITVKGRVSSTDGNIDRRVKILLDDTRLVEETVPGQFSLEVTPPKQTPAGKHNLTVSVASQGRYAGATKTQSINISRLPIQIDTQTPQIAILPKTIQISGSVYHELGPVPNARVLLNFKNSSSETKTSPDGSFTAGVEAPLDLSLIGPQEITIAVEPVEPWYTSLRVKTQLYTLNPLSTGSMLVVLIALVLLIYTKSKTRLREKIIVPQAQLIELPAITTVLEPKPRYTGIKGRIFSAYQVGLEAVEKITGLSMAPNITLREFLETVTRLSPTAIKLFTELTTITEITLYSARSLQEEIATRAEQLTATIKKELHRGAS